MDTDVGSVVDRKSRNSLFQLRITRMSRMGKETHRGWTPIRRPSLAKDAKCAKELMRDLQPLGALCALCERTIPGLEDPETNYDGFRSGSRFTPRREEAAEGPQPLGDFVTLCEDNSGIERHESRPRMDSDPAAVSRQGRQVREGTYAGPPAAWRPLRSLREKFSEKGRFLTENRDFGSETARTCRAEARNGVFRRFLTIFHLRVPLRLVSDPKTVSRQGRQMREGTYAGPPAAWRSLRSLREKFSENCRFLTENRKREKGSVSKREKGSVSRKEKGSEKGSVS